MCRLVRWGSVFEQLLLSGQDAEVSPGGAGPSRERRPQAVSELGQRKYFPHVKCVLVVVGFVLFF